MRHFIKLLLPLCLLGFGLGCPESEQGLEKVEVGDDAGEVQPIEEKPDGTTDDAKGAY